MILKSKIVKEKVVKVVSTKKTETYAEALVRIKKIIVKELSVDGVDCQYLIATCHCSCDGCPLGTKDALNGSRCIETRIINIFDEAISKSKGAKV